MRPLGWGNALPEVLIVAEDGDAGGIGRYCVDLAALLGARAHVVCLCPTACEARRAGSPANARPMTWQLVRVPMPARGWRSWVVTGLIRALEIQPTTHDPRQRPARQLRVVGGSLVSMPGFRYVTTAHGVLGLHARRNVLYRVVDLAASRGATRVIAVSADTRRRLVRAGSPGGRTVVILNGLGEAELRAYGSVAERRTQRPAQGPLRVGFLGRLSPEKGTRELLEVARSLLAEDTSSTARDRGRRSGPGVAGERRAGTDGDRAAFPGEGAIRDVAGFLASVDVLVMPSHNEGLPYVLLEAMAAGCGVVAFRVGGIPEVVADESMGVLVEPGDVRALVRAVVELAADPARVRSLGQAAAAHVQARFALRDRLPDLARAYGRELAPAPRSAAASGNPPA
jgi:glycosyltransferase involved in cell wall biosynthesis